VSNTTDLLASTTYRLATQAVEAARQAAGHTGHYLEQVGSAKTYLEQVVDAYRKSGPQSSTAPAGPHSERVVTPVTFEYDNWESKCALTAHENDDSRNTTLRQFLQCAFEAKPGPAGDTARKYGEKIGVKCGSALHPYVQGAREKMNTQQMKHALEHMTHGYFTGTDNRVRPIFIDYIGEGTSRCPITWAKRLFADNTLIADARKGVDKATNQASTAAKTLPGQALGRGLELMTAHCPPGMVLHYYFVQRSLLQALSTLNPMADQGRIVRDQISDHVRKLFGHEMDRPDGQGTHGYPGARTCYALKDWWNTRPYVTLPLYYPFDMRPGINIIRELMGLNKHAPPAPLNWRLQWPFCDCWDAPCSPLMLLLSYSMVMHGGQDDMAAAAAMANAAWEPEGWDHWFDADQDGPGGDTNTDEAGDTQDRDTGLDAWGESTDEDIVCSSGEEGVFDPEYDVFRTWSYASDDDSSADSVDFLQELLAATESSEMRTSTTNQETVVHLPPMSNWQRAHLANPPPPGMHEVEIAFGPDAARAQFADYLAQEDHVPLRADMPGDDKPAEDYVWHTDARAWCCVFVVGAYTRPIVMNLWAMADYIVSITPPFWPQPTAIETVDTVFDVFGTPARNWQNVALCVRETTFISRLMSVGRVCRCDLDLSDDSVFGAPTSAGVSSVAESAVGGVLNNYKTVLGAAFFTYIVGKMGFSPVTSLTQHMWSYWDETRLTMEEVDYALPVETMGFAMPPDDSYDPNDTVDVFLDRASHFASQNRKNFQVRSMSFHDVTPEDVDFSQSRHYSRVENALQVAVYSDIGNPNWDRHLVMTESEEMLLLTINPRVPEGKFRHDETEVNYWIDRDKYNFDPGTNVVTQSKIWRYTGATQRIAWGNFEVVYRTRMYKTNSPHLRIVHLNRVWWGYVADPRTWCIQRRNKETMDPLDNHDFSCCHNPEDECPGYTVVGDEDSVWIKAGGKSFAGITRYQHDSIKAWCEGNGTKVLNAWTINKIIGTPHADVNVLLDYYKLCPTVTRHDTEIVTKVGELITWSLMCSDVGLSKHRLMTQIAEPLMGWKAIPGFGNEKGAVDGMSPLNNMHAAIQERMSKPQWRKPHLEEVLDRDKKLKITIGAAALGIVKHCTPQEKLTPRSEERLIAEASSAQQVSSYEKAFDTPPLTSEDNAPAINAFLKNEGQAITSKNGVNHPSKPRHISVMGPQAYGEMGKYYLPISEQLFGRESKGKGKTGVVEECYAFSKNPREISLKMAALFKGGREAVEGDFSGFDGHANEAMAGFELAIFLACYAAEHHDNITSMFTVGLYGAWTRAYDEMVFTQGSATKSGKHDTSGMNTFLVFFILVTSVAYTTGCTIEEAIDWVKHNSLIGGDDWVCVKPDNITLDDFEAGVRHCAFGFAQELTMKKFRGTGTISFISRNWPNAGDGDPRNCGTIERMGGAITISILPEDATPLVKWNRFAAKNYALRLTDLHTPLIGIFLKLVCDINESLAKVNALHKERAMGIHNLVTSELITWAQVRNYPKLEEGETVDDPDGTIKEAFEGYMESTRRLMWSPSRSKFSQDTWHKMSWTNKVTTLTPETLQTEKIKNDVSYWARKFPDREVQWINERTQGMEDEVYGALNDKYVWPEMEKLTMKLQQRLDDNPTDLAVIRELMYAVMHMPNFNIMTGIHSSRTGATLLVLDPASGLTEMVTRHDFPASVRQTETGGWVCNFLKNVTIPGKITKDAKKAASAETAAEESETAEETEASDHTSSESEANEKVEEDTTEVEAPESCGYAHCPCFGGGDNSDCNLLYDFEVPVGARGFAKDPIDAVARAIESKGYKLTGTRLRKTLLILLLVGCVDLHIPTIDQLSVKINNVIEQRAVNLWYFGLTQIIATWPPMDPDEDDFTPERALAQATVYSSVCSTPDEAMKDIAKKMPVVQETPPHDKLLGVSAQNIGQGWGKPTNSNILKLSGRRGDDSDTDSNAEWNGNPKTPGILTCMDCSRRFEFGTEEQAHFKKSGFKPPVRCRACRLDKKTGKLRANDYEDDDWDQDEDIGLDAWGNNVDPNQAPKTTTSKAILFDFKGKGNPKGKKPKKPSGTKKRVRGHKPIPGRRSGGTSSTASATSHSSSSGTWGENPN